ncbi:MAG: YhgE/Pip domain-containing protein [Lachnospiraceae bacterium]|nr:YhgE/Pip domain-containing protein [Lachnospiraceae bacterium]
MAQTLFGVTSQLETSLDQGTAGGKAQGKLSQMEGDLEICVSLLDTYISLIDATNNMINAAGEITREADTIKNNMATLADGTRSAVDSAGHTADAAGDLVTVNLSAIGDELVRIDTEVEGILKLAEAGTRSTNTKIEAVRTIVETRKNQFDTIRRYISKSPVSISGNVREAADTVDNDFLNLSNDLNNIQTFNAKTLTDTKAFYEAVKKDVKKCRADINTLTKAYEDEVAPQVENTLDSVKTSVGDVKDMLNMADDGITSLTGMLKSYPDMMSLGRDKLIKSRKNIVKMQKRIRKIREGSEQLKANKYYQSFLDIMKTDPEFISEFISNPVEIKTKAMYPMENNGSAMAPFYIVLSIWVGALIQVAIIHTKPKGIEGLTNLNHVQEFFGRYMLFFIIGQIQTVITVLGALLFVGIQCEHPFMLMFAMSVTSLCFTLLIYSLTFAFEAVGEAITVVLMVIQVAGAGGTFPIEVLPEPYQVAYNYMPFVYGISAAREAVAGLYKNDYWRYLFVLFGFMAIALVIGLGISILFRKANIRIKESTEKTQLMI